MSQQGIPRHIDLNKRLNTVLKQATMGEEWSKGEILRTQDTDPRLLGLVASRGVFLYKTELRKSSNPAEKAMTNQ